jgi:molybdate transport system substrate-binding protein
MRAPFFALLLLTASAVAADAADITVFAPGVASVGLRKLADAWTAETGNKVTITGGNVGRILENVNGNVPADLVLLPPASLDTIAAKLKPGSTMVLGRAVFGLAVQTGRPHPDISTMEKFVAALKTAGEIGFPDPKDGSLSGTMVTAMLQRPEFAGVTPKPLHETAGNVAKHGDAKLAGGALSEEVTLPGSDLVGAFPVALDMHIDLSLAVLGYAAQPNDAAAFQRYVTRAQAGPVWHGCGIEVSDAIAATPRMSCIDANQPPAR